LRSTYFVFRIIVYVYVFVCVVSAYRHFYIYVVLLWKRHWPLLGLLYAG
jgi:hypothetical protein